MADKLGVLDDFDSTPLLRDDMERLKDWLTLLRTPLAGDKALLPLIKRAGGAGGVLRAAPGELAAHGISPEGIKALADVDQALVEADLDWLSEDDHHLITWDDEAYPAQLRQIASPPAALFVVGDPSVLWLPQIAIIGSRKATRGGLDNARLFARSLAQRGLIVTSGLALGVDGAAHTAALAAGGRSVAVAGCGPDLVYPARHRDLAQQLVEGGALVSEFAPGTPPLRHNFPRRNRLISGLATGVLVVEAAERSGSLITARHAMEQGREVFAIPGSIHNPMARGCHRLIREGARLVERAEDIVEELAVALGEQIRVARDLSDSTQAPISLGEDTLDGDYLALLDAIAYDPQDVDSLVEATGFTADAISSMLLILELQGRVSSDAGGTYSRIGEGTR